MKNYNTPDELLTDICELFNVPKEKLIRLCRKTELVRIRHYYCYIGSIYYNKRFSLKYLGENLGRDHTSIIHGRDKIIGFISINDKMTVNDIDRIKVALDLTQEKESNVDDLINENANLQRQVRRLKVINTKLSHDNLLHRIEIKRLNQRYKVEVLQVQTSNND
jgi:hypothetical protein